MSTWTHNFLFRLLLSEGSRRRERCRTVPFHSFSPPFLTASQHLCPLWLPCCPLRSLGFLTRAHFPDRVSYHVSRLGQSACGSLWGIVVVAMGVGRRDEINVAG